MKISLVLTDWREILCRRLRTSDNDGINSKKNWAKYGTLWDTRIDEESRGSGFSIFPLQLSFYLVLLSCHQLSSFQLFSFCSCGQPVGVRAFKRRLCLKTTAE